MRSTQNPLDDLRAAKLGRLVEHITGKKLKVSGSVGCVQAGRAFYLASDIRSLGPAICWAHSQKADTLTVLAEFDLAAELIRRANRLSPSLEVSVRGFSFNQGQPTIAEPKPEALLPAPQIPAAHSPFISMIEQAGAVAVNDYGCLTAEVDGLEIARVVTETDLQTGYSQPMLSVGVGAADRELHAVTNAHLEPVEKLVGVIDTVKENRRPGPHPMARMAQQRWLRSVLLAQPTIIGCQRFEALSPLRASSTILGAEPAAGISTDDGVVIGCQVGVDLDLVPEVMDFVERSSQYAEVEIERVVLVVPERDAKLLAKHLKIMVGPDHLYEIFSPDLPWQV